MKDYDRVDLVGWCSYCHGEIYSDEDYIHENSDYFHTDCDVQMNTYIDEYGENHYYDK